jgi:hypothetical protein
MVINKLVVAFLIILFILGVAIYFRVEFKYMMVLNGRGTLLLSELNKASKVPLAANESPEDRVSVVAEKNGVKFASDYLIMENSLFHACNPDCLKKPAFYKNYSKLISQIQLKKLWVVEQNKMKDSVAYYIQDREEKKFLDSFKSRRSYISDNYDKIPNYDLKEMAISVTQAIDAKVLELKKR